MKSFQPKPNATHPESGDGPDDPPLPPPAADGPASTPAETSPSPETAPLTATRPGDRNAEVDFRAQKRSNATHASVTDPEARLYKKSPGTGASLCFIGHTLMDMRNVPPSVRGTCRLRNGLIVGTGVTQADGYAERRAALDMIHRNSPGSTRRLTLAASNLARLPRMLAG